MRDGLGWYLIGGSTAMDGTCQDVPREDIVWMAWKDGQRGHSGLVGLCWQMLISIHNFGALGRSAGSKLCVSSAEGNNSVLVTSHGSYTG